MTEEKNRVKAVNVVFLITIFISTTASFLPLGFLAEIPVLNLVFSQFIIVLPSILYMVWYRLPYKEAVRLRKIKCSNLLLSLLFGILIQPAMTLLNAFSMVFASNTTSNFLMHMSMQVPLIVSLFFIAVVPAILEETVYRGVFFNEYRKVNLWKGALLSGFLFGLMHGNLNQFCYAAVMGVLFALLIEATGSILSTMLVHFWTNAGSVVLIYLYPKLYEVGKNFYQMYLEYGNTELAQQIELIFGDMTLSQTEWMEQVLNQSSQMTLTVGQVLSLYGPGAVVSGVLAFFVYKKIAKRTGNWERICHSFRTASEMESIPKQNEVQKEQQLVTPPLIAAIIIGIAFMIFYELQVR